MTNKEEFKKELEVIHQKGYRISIAIEVFYLEDKKMNEIFENSQNDKKKEEINSMSDTITLKSEYNKWYSKAFKVVQMLLPERLEEFKESYRKKGKSTDLDITDYTIEKFLNNITFPLYSAENVITRAFNLFRTQLNILESAVEMLDSIFYDLKGEIEFDIYKDELDMAKGLLKNKLYRPAGIIAGVALESHLKSLHIKKNIKLVKDLHNLIESLKKNKIINNDQKRKLDYTAGIRNKCTHKDREEPTKEEVQELIGNVNWAISTIL